MMQTVTYWDRADQDDDDDDQGHDRIDVHAARVIATKHDDERRYDDTYRAKRVAQHVKQHRLNVHVARFRVETPATLRTTAPGRRDSTLAIISIVLGTVIIAVGAVPVSMIMDVFMPVSTPVSMPVAMPVSVSVSVRMPGSTCIAVLLGRH